ncbi:hypothetical protein [Sulfurimonas sp.]|uniref:hypothetical protein n=1 Tax=Sulfurimonas sp. TaxID=2022749 RepID=UPI00356518F1
MKYKFIFLLLLGLDALNLILQTSQISISYRESLMLYGDFSLLQLITKISISVLGQNDFALRLPVILAHLMSVVLIYDISKHYIKDDANRLWLVSIFILLPGVLSSAVVVDKAGFIIFGLLLFIWLYFKNYKKIYIPLLIVYALSEESFIYLFLALLISGIFRKNQELFITGIITLLISLYLYGVDAHGSPQGHFLDALALYAAIFSPIVFLYIIFVLYRKYLTDKEDIVWFISATGFLVSIILSFRQDIKIEHFAPYLIIALPLAGKKFINSYRVRLKEFRKTYRIMFQISLVLLLINATVVIFNKELYRFIDNPTKHFVYKFHIAKELAKELNRIGVNCIDTNYKLQKRLHFYGVTKCDKHKLIYFPQENENIDSVTISYKNKAVYAGYVTNINK